MALLVSDPRARKAKAEGTQAQDSLGCVANAIKKRKALTDLAPFPILFCMVSLLDS
jgi:hypothetical protein